MKIDMLQLELPQISIPRPSASYGLLLDKCSKGHNYAPSRLSDDLVKIPSQYRLPISLLFTLGIGITVFGYGCVGITAIIVEKISERNTASDIAADGSVGFGHITLCGKRC
jgi:hypothetical protein